MPPVDREDPRRLGHALGTLNASAPRAARQRESDGRWDDLAMRTAVMSDPRLGRLAGGDVLQNAAVLGDPDRLATLGDVFELRERRTHALVVLARGLSEELGRTLPVGAEVILLPGDHDYPLARPVLRQIPRRLLGLEQTPAVAPATCSVRSPRPHPRPTGDRLPRPHRHWLNGHDGAHRSMRLARAIRIPGHLRSNRGRRAGARPGARGACGPRRSLDRLDRALAAVTTRVPNPWRVSGALGKRWSSNANFFTSGIYGSDVKVDVLDEEALAADTSNRAPLGGCAPRERLGGGGHRPSRPLFGHPNLFVTDRAIVPAAIGRNLR